MSNNKNILVGLCKGRHEISFLSDEQYALSELDPGNIPAIQEKANAWAGYLLLFFFDIYYVFILFI